MILLLVSSTSPPSPLTKQPNHFAVRLPFLLKPQKDQSFVVKPLLFNPQSIIATPRFDSGRPLVTCTVKNPVFVRASMATLVAKVRRELLEACLTCSICKKLLQDATTISECLHTFCRKCIHEKLTNEELECCPMCNIDLGCAPLEKLRPDHNLQDVRSKIFPLKRRKMSAPEIAPSISLPVRRKERSLSSLVVDTPRVAEQSGLMGRRTKAVARKAAALRGASSTIDDSVKQEEDSTEDCEDSSSSPECLSKTSHRKQNASHPEPSNHLSNRDMENKIHTSADKSELWEPLTCLVEAANQSKSTKYSPHTSTAQPEQSGGLDSKMEVHKSKRRREHPHKYKIQDEKNSSALVSVKAKGFGGTRKRAATARDWDLYNSAQALFDASGVRCERGTGPMWLSLVASADWEGGEALPQISARYLRIKDGNLPASFIQKYLAMKLDLPSESEVSITCRGEPVVPTLELHKLVDLWQPTGLSQKSHAIVGTPAKEFVMIVNYGRKDHV